MNAEAEPKTLILQSKYQNLFDCVHHFSLPVSPKTESIIRCRGTKRKSCFVSAIGASRYSAILFMYPRKCRIDDD